MNYLAYIIIYFAEL